MAESSSSDLAGLLNEMLSLQERLKKHGVSFGAGVPGPPAGSPEVSVEEARVSTEAVASISVGLQDRTDLFPTFWGEPVSAFHGRMGFSANQWLHNFESFLPADQPPELRDGAYWVRKFPLNASGGVALSELVSDLESAQGCFGSFQVPILILVPLPLVLLRLRRLLLLQQHLRRWMLQQRIFLSPCSPVSGAAGGFA